MRVVLATEASLRYTVQCSYLNENNLLLFVRMPLFDIRASSTSLTSGTDARSPRAARASGDCLYIFSATRCTSSTLTDSAELDKSKHWHFALHGKLSQT